jgi:DNA-binding SARP family transcriptional activator
MYTFDVHLLRDSEAGPGPMSAEGAAAYDDTTFEDTTFDDTTFDDTTFDDTTFDDTRAIEPVAVPSGRPEDARYVLLGPPGVRHPGGSAWVAGRRQTMLFAMLALSVGGPVETGRIAHALWGTTLPQDPDNALQSQVSRLRRVVGERTVRLRAAGYELCCDPEQVDAVRLERLVARGRRLLSGGAPVAAHGLADEALALWTGEPLTELADDDVMRREAARLTALHLDAQVLRAQAMLGMGQHEAAVAPLESMVVQHPLREDLWALLMLALYRSQRTADALDAYRRARQSLVRELGLEPGTRLRDLERAILAGSASLAAPLHPCAAHAPLLAGGTDGPRPLEIPPAIGPRGVGPGWDQYPATRLFVDRVRVTRPDFRPGPREAAQVVGLCRILGGDPLAIELAAHASAVMGLGRVVARHTAMHTRREEAALDEAARRALD